MDPRQLFEASTSSAEGDRRDHATDRYLSGSVDFQDYMNFLLKKSKEITTKSSENTNDEGDTPGTSSLQSFVQRVNIEAGKSRNRNISIDNSDSLLEDLSGNRIGSYSNAEEMEYDEDEEDAEADSSGFLAGRTEGLDESDIVERRTLLQSAPNLTQSEGVSFDSDEEEPELVRLMVEPPVDSLFSSEGTDSADPDYKPRRGGKIRRKPATTSVKREAEVLGIPPTLANEEAAAPENQDVKRGRIRQLPEALQSLMGHANLTFAQGRKDEAIRMMEEVIRQQANAYEPYRTMAYFYHEMGDRQKELQFGLLGAYLDYLTDETTWADLGTLARELDKPDSAVLCFTRACKQSENPWPYFEIRLDLLEHKLCDSRRLIDCKLEVAKTMVKVNCDPQWYLNLVGQYIKEFETKGDTEAVLTCKFHYLEMMKLHEMDVQETLLDYINRLLNHGSYLRAATGCITFLDVKWLTAEGEAVNSFTLDPSKPSSSAAQIESMQIPGPISTDLLLKFFAALIQSARHAQEIIGVVSKFVESRVSLEEIEYQRVAEALISIDMNAEAENLLARMLKFEVHSTKVAPWFSYAKLLLQAAKLDEAVKGFETVLSLDPQHVTARVHLTDLQVRLGKTKDALGTLIDFEGADNYILKDERLVHQECMLHHAEKRWEDFLKVGWRLLAPYFGEVYNIPGKPQESSGHKIRLGLRVEILRFLKNTPLERFIQKSLNASRSSAKSKERVLSEDEMYNICFKMCEVLFDQKRYWDMLLTAGYTAIQPRLRKRPNLAHQFVSMALLAAIRARQGKIAFQILRQYTEDSTKLWNLHGLIFSIAQDVSFHRFILRKAGSTPDNVPVTVISGNNSLVAGTYIHALMEYLAALEKVPLNPMVNLMAGLCYVHLACKKDVTRRQELLYQGLAFITQYEELRGVPQEVWYNLGRAMHQANILFAAIHYYKKVLDAPPVVAESISNAGEQPSRRVYDLRPMAAHNLSLIYKESGNFALGREYLEKYCVIE